MNNQITWKIVQGTINDHLVRLESSNGIFSSTVQY